MRGGGKGLNGLAISGGVFFATSLVYNYVLREDVEYTLSYNRADRAERLAKLYRSLSRENEVTPFP